MQQSLRYLLAVAVPVLAQVSPDINGSPSRQFGHPKLLTSVTTVAPNLIEGRELNGPTSIAFDTSTSPPILYISDSLNNRVLAWRNAESITAGNPADKVIGQRDFSSTFSHGPGTSFATGFTLPSGIAVDRNGNLYVADAGNNRILRFPPPFQAQGENLIPDLVIGQKAVQSGNIANQGLPAPTAKTVAFNRGGARTVGLTFDLAGNLWITDPLNHRVLRYPVSQLAANTIEPTADLVLGQFNFLTDSLPDSQNQTQRNLSALIEPSSLAFDSRGGLYAADLFDRVLYFASPSNNGAPATRVLGVRPQPAPGQQAPPYPTEHTLGSITSVDSAECVFTFGVVVFVCDSPQNRIARYASPETWPAATNEAPSPPLAAVYGQADFRSGMTNRGQRVPANNSLARPTGGAFLNGTMWIVDTSNHRVLAFPQGPSAEPAFQFPGASRVVGQIGYDQNAPNLVEGKELFVNSSLFRGASIAVDRNSTPNHLYLADSLNNRVLAFRDVRKVGVDARGNLEVPPDADLIVIGQPSRFNTAINYPTGDSLLPTDSGLFFPSGVTVDQFGNLYVADFGNGRVVRFPAPFKQPAGTLHRANLVLGQPSLTTKVQQAGVSTMSGAFGVALFSHGAIAVSDTPNNRVMIFRRAGADFASGQSAQTVLGQQTFESGGASSSAAGLSSPRGLAVDSSDRLYVADRNNNRLVIYGSTQTIANGTTGTTLTSNLNQPEGVAVSGATGEIWVASSANNFIFRFREFSALAGNPTPTAQLSATAPIAVTLDAFDNVIVVEAANRMTFYFAQAFYKHAATFASGANLQPTLTPGMITLLARSGRNFEFEPAEAQSFPLPKVLSGVQVLVNGVPAPIFRIDPAVINFIVPNNAPESGSAEYLVTRPDTGEILAAGTFAMARAAPGFFTLNQQGTGQIVATFTDGDTVKVNGPANPIDRDQVLTLWMTGFGRIPNLPPDGEVVGAVPTPEAPRIILNAQILDSSRVLYSGTAPGFPGLWQVNIRIPNVASGGPAPGANSIVLFMYDLRSNIGGTTTIGQDRELLGTNGLITTIFVK